MIVVVSLIAGSCLALWLLLWSISFQLELTNRLLKEMRDRQLPIIVKDDKLPKEAIDRINHAFGCEVKDL